MVANQMEYMSAIDGLDVRTPRIEALRETFYKSPVHICPERSHLATMSWKATEGQTLNLRRARLFARICDEIPIAIFERELIVGSQTHFIRGVGLQLDFNSKVGFEIVEGDRRLRAEQATGIVSDADLKIIEQDSLFWRGKSPGEVMLRTIHEIMGPVFEETTAACTRAYGAFTNFVPDADYGKVICHGLKGIIEEIEGEIAGLEFTSPQDGIKYSFLKAAQVCCEAQIGLSRRYAACARQMALEEKDAIRKKELETIADVCANVPENPPRNFWEALQSLRFIHLGLYLEDANGSGASLDRLDQYLYPIYKKDLDQGLITRQQAAELLAAFWVKVAATERIPPSYVKTAGAGYVQTRVILGGVDRKGNHAANELTYLILHVAGQMNMDLPLYLRWNSRMPRDLILKAIQTNIQVGSEPAFHNDEQIIPGLVADGAALEDARDYVLRGCSHPYPYGSAYGSVQMFINGAKILELVMYDGHDPLTGKQIGIRTGDPRGFQSIQEWIDAYLKQWSHFYAVVIKGYNIGEITQMSLYSQPFASALTPDCIQKGLDVHQGGCRYNQFTGDIMNKVYADVVDSLVAIEETVYRDRKMTVDQLLEACSNNFEGVQGEHLRRILEKASKFGNDLGEPEAIYRMLNDHVATVSRSHKGYFGYPKRDTRVGGAVHMAQGQAVGALPSGRKAGMPLSDGGISPCAGFDTQGPTATMRSVAKALDFATNRSAVLNQKMPKDLLKTKDELNRFADLIEAFFKGYNGYQIQWNIHGVEEYLAAQKTPAPYKNLIVRVGGYSAYFVELDPNLQKQIITRSEQHL
jgi:pyruvate formate-lyase/glycerol dehydratase family glycyl radical enzyme